MSVSNQPVSDQGFKTGGGSLEQQLTAVSAQLSSDPDWNQSWTQITQDLSLFFLNIVMTSSLDIEDGNNQHCPLCLIIKMQLSYLIILMWVCMSFPKFFNIWINSCRGKDCSTVERQNLMSHSHLGLFLLTSKIMLQTRITPNKILHHFVQIRGVSNSSAPFKYPGRLGDTSSPGCGLQAGHEVILSLSRTTAK